MGVPFSAPVTTVTSSPASTTTAPPSFDALYEEHFDFVWRSLRRLGVWESNLDDAAQDVFVVVHRRLADFEGRSSARTWLFGIALRVAKDHRRTLRRKGGHDELTDAVPDRGKSPQDSAESSETLRVLDRMLDALDDDKRAVFVLAELEQMTAPEIADALGVPVNTVYSRLRAARAEFDKAVARHHAATGVKR